jgi:protein-disulfide isomerase
MVVRKSSSAKLAHLQKRLQRARALNVVLAIAVAFLLVIAIAQTTGGSALPRGGGTPSPAEPSVSGASSDTAPTGPPAFSLGDSNAAVVFTEWTDFRCPYCAVFANEVMPGIIADYVDKGLVRYELHDVAYFGVQSATAAVAVRAAGEQGKYLDYLKVLYAAAPEHGHPDLPTDRLVEFAKQAGVADLAAFTRRLTSRTLRSAVDQSTDRSQKLGVTSTPFFLVGDTVVSGAQPLSVFRKAIDTQLHSAGK